MLSNTCPPRITATAGTKLVGTKYLNTVIIIFKLRILQPMQDLHHSYSIAGSSFRSLSNIPHCCLQKELGSYFIPNVADRTPIPAKDLRLGKPLLHQLPNPTRAHQKSD